MAPVLIDADDLEPGERLERRLDRDLRLLATRHPHALASRVSRGSSRRSRTTSGSSTRSGWMSRRPSGRSSASRTSSSGSSTCSTPSGASPWRVPPAAGKTLVAAEKARRLATQGFDVLFTCFNRPLADHLRKALARRAEDPRVGLPPALPRPREGGRRGDVGEARRPRVLGQQLPEYLGQAVDRLGPRFDALIVDEAQDFEESWWLPLQMLLRDPDHGVIYVFYDDNQAIYRRPGGLPEGLVSARLTENWRNTSPIFDAVMGFYSGGKVTCAGPDGPPIEMASVPKEDLRSELSKLLHRLIEEGDLEAKDVVVLTPHAPAHSPVLGQVGAFKLTDDPVGKRDVRLSSIFRYKGLDAPAVVDLRRRPLFVRGVHEADVRGVL